MMVHELAALVDLAGGTQRLGHMLHLQHWCLRRWLRTGTLSHPERGRVLRRLQLLHASLAEPWTMLRCPYCGTSWPAMCCHVDHVVPQSRGGPDIHANRVACCPPCNHGKRDKLPSEWLDPVPWRVLAIERAVVATMDQPLGPMYDSRLKGQPR
jgi:5-methylcytosine-specific restriction endonuclease McrA